MKGEEYCGQGTAEMVGKILMASLGLTREEVGQKFKHGTYDGVYASPEERVAGGGSLSLMNHFADWCGLPKKEFSGHWDVGHKLQLVYGATLKKNKEVASFLSVSDLETYKVFANGRQVGLGNSYWFSRVSARV